MKSFVTAFYYLASSSELLAIVITAVVDLLQASWSLVRAELGYSFLIYLDKIPSRNNRTMNWFPQVWLDASVLGSSAIQATDIRIHCDVDGNLYSSPMHWQ